MDDTTKKPSLNIQMQKLNLHFYDGKIACSEFIQAEILRISDTPKEDKMVAFAKLKENLKNISPQALGCLNAIINAHQNFGRRKHLEIDTPQGKRPGNDNPNYDPSNNFFACDFLYLCYERVCVLKDKDFLVELVIQLTDMASGLCAPGRCSRLYMILDKTD